MADFKEVFEKIKDLGFAFSIVASGKRKGALSMMVGSTPLKEAEYADRLFPLLKLAGWDPQTPDDPELVADKTALKLWYVRVFLGAVKDAIMPPEINSKKNRNLNDGDGKVLKEMTNLKFPERLSDTRLTEVDRELLKGLRICDTGDDGNLILLHTGVGSSQYTGISYSSTTLAGDIRKTLRSCPASDADKQMEEEWIYAERKVLEYTILSRANENLGENKKSVDEMEEISDRIAREYAHGCVKYLTRLDTYNALLDRLIQEMSQKVSGSESPYLAGVDVLKGCNSTLLRRSRLISLWYHEETTKNDEGGDVTFSVADRFGRNGDWADIIAESVDILWGKNELYIDPPKVISNDPTEPCLNFIDLNGKAKEAEGGETEAWGRFLKKMTPEEGDVFKAFIWSIFDARNHGRQILYLYDDGYSGKSAVMKAIQEALGTRLCGAVQKDSMSNQFAFSKVWDKRLVTIGDNKNTHLHQSEKMKMLTGNDMADVERKNRDSFSWVMSAKVMVASNTPLEVNLRERNERTRVLPIKINFTIDQMIEEGVVAVDEAGKPKFDKYGDPIFVGDGTDWPSRLRDQFWSFMASCRPAYESLCPRHTDIIIPDSCLNNLETFSNDLMDDYQAIFDNICVVDNLAFTRSSELKRTFGRAVSELFDKDPSLKYEGFKEFLHTHYKLTISRSREVENRARGYMGIRLKSATDNESSLI